MSSRKRTLADEMDAGHGAVACAVMPVLSSQTLLAQNLRVSQVKIA
jgi:hypothetical protein